MNRELYETVTSHRHRELRREPLPDLSAEYAAKGLSPRARMSDRFCRLMNAETPHILPGQKIVFLRTVPKPYDCFTEAEWEEIQHPDYAGHWAPGHGHGEKTGPNAGGGLVDAE